MTKKFKKIELTKRFMEEHGERKKSMKVNWYEYIEKLERGKEK